MILRPYGLVIDGVLQFGMELLTEGSRILDVRPHTGSSENFVISPAFVNAHSHLEYRGLQDRMTASQYWTWIREITELKKTQSESRVRQETIAAAHENRRTGVAMVAEHSDRPYAATAMISAGLGGAIFQETITFFERETRLEKLALIRRRAEGQAKVWRQPVFLTPHAYQTVDEQTLAEFGASGEPISIHVAETPFESELTREGLGPIADFRRQAGFEIKATGKSIVQTLASLGLARQGAQFVHCCDVDGRDIETMALNEVTVAHCPRSNIRLGCPAAPVREMLDAGITIGLGMDSPASSGPIDMFDEMRAAIKVASDRGEPLRPDEVWTMATNLQALAFANSNLPNGRVEPGSCTPLIKIAVPGARTISEVIERGKPSLVSWV